MAQSYMDKLKAQQEDEFIERAAGSIEKGISWEMFLEKNPEYTIANQAKWGNLYGEMQSRRRKSKGAWGADQEMALAADRRRADAIRVGEQRMYEDMKEDLLEIAATCAPWSEAKAKLSLTEDIKPLYERAQAEAGILPSQVREDAFDAAFHLGFMG